MQTTPLGFKKPEAQDLADLRVFVGDNMDLIDAEISNIGGLLQETKLGISGSSTSPHEVNITISQTSDFKLKPVEVLKFSPGTQDVVNTISSFTNGEASDFISDSFVTFDGDMKLKTSYSQDMNDDGTLGNGKIFSIVINKNDFTSIESIEVI